MYVYHELNVTYASMKVKFSKIRMYKLKKKNELKDLVCVYAMKGVSGKWDAGGTGGPDNV